MWGVSGRCSAVEELIEVALRGTESAKDCVRKITVILKGGAAQNRFTPQAATPTEEPSFIADWVANCASCSPGTR
jgi:hypothetical protein